MSNTNLEGPSAQNEGNNQDVPVQNETSASADKTGEASPPVIDLTSDSIPVHNLNEDAAAVSIKLQQSLQNPDKDSAASPNPVAGKLAGGADAPRGFFPPVAAAVHITEQTFIPAGAHALTDLKVHGLPVSMRPATSDAGRPAYFVGGIPLGVLLALPPPGAADTLDAYTAAMLAGKHDEDVAQLRWHYEHSAVPSALSVRPEFSNMPHLSVHKANKDVTPEADPAPPLPRELSTQPPIPTGPPHEPVGAFPDTQIPDYANVVGLQPFPKPIAVDYAAPVTYSPPATYVPMSLALPKHYSDQKRRTMGGYVDMKYNLVRYHQGTTTNTKISRWLTPSLAPLAYANGIPMTNDTEIYRLVLLPNMTKLGIDAVDKEVGSAISALRTYFADSPINDTLTGVARKTIQSLTGMTFTPHRVVWRLASLVCAGMHAKKCGTTMRLESAPNFPSYVGAIGTYAAHLMKNGTQTGSLNFYSAAHADTLSPMLTIMAVINSIAAPPIAYANGYPMPTVCSVWPALGIPTSNAFYYGTQVREYHYGELDLTDIWRFAISWCGQHGCLRLFREYMDILPILMFSTAPDLAPIFQSAEWSITLPNCKMAPSILIPLSVSLSDWQADAEVPELPSASPTMYTGAALSMAIGLAARTYAQACGMSTWLHLKRGDDILKALMAQYAGRSCYTPAMLQVERVLESVGITGQLGAVLRTLSPDLATLDKFKHWFSQMNAYQWEEIAPLVSQVPICCALNGIIEPLVSGRLPAVGALHTAKALGGRNNPEIYQGLSHLNRGIHWLLLLRDQATQDAYKVDYRPTKNYRLTSSDWQFAERVSRHNMTADICFKVKDTSAAVLMHRGIFGEQKPTWYIEECIPDYRSTALAENEHFVPYSGSLPTEAHHTTIEAKIIADPANPRSFATVLNKNSQQMAKEAGKWDELVSEYLTKEYWIGSATYLFEQPPGIGEGSGGAWKPDSSHQDNVYQGVTDPELLENVMAANFPAEHRVPFLEWCHDVAIRATQYQPSRNNQLSLATTANKIEMVLQSLSYAAGTRAAEASLPRTPRATIIGGVLHAPRPTWGSDRATDNVAKPAQAQLDATVPPGPPMSEDELIRRLAARLQIQSAFSARDIEQSLQVEDLAITCAKDPAQVACSAHIPPSGTAATEIEYVIVALTALLRQLMYDSRYDTPTLCCKLMPNSANTTHARAQGDTFHRWVQGVIKQEPWASMYIGTHANVPCTPDEDPRGAFSLVEKYFHPAAELAVERIVCAYARKERLRRAALQAKVKVGTAAPPPLTLPKTAYHKDAPPPVVAAQPPATLTEKLVSEDTDQLLEFPKLGQSVQQFRQQLQQRTPMTGQDFTKELGNIVTGLEQLQTNASPALAPAAVPQTTPKATNWKLSYKFKKLAPTVVSRYAPVGEEAPPPPSVCNRAQLDAAWKYYTALGHNLLDAGIATMADKNLQANLGTPESRRQPHINFKKFTCHLIPFLPTGSHISEVFDILTAYREAIDIQRQQYVVDRQANALALAMQATTMLKSAEAGGPTGIKIGGRSAHRKPTAKPMALADFTPKKKLSAAEAARKVTARELRVAIESGGPITEYQAWTDIREDVHTVTSNGITPKAIANLREVLVEGECAVHYDRTAGYAVALCPLTDGPPSDPALKAECKVANIAPALREAHRWYATRGIPPHLTATGLLHPPDSMHLSDVIVMIRPWHKDHLFARYLFNGVPKANIDKAWTAVQVKGRALPTIVRRGKIGTPAQHDSSTDTSGTAAGSESSPLAQILPLEVLRKVGLPAPNPTLPTTSALPDAGSTTLAFTNKYAALEELADAAEAAQADIELDPELEAERDQALALQLAAAEEAARHESEVVRQKIMEADRAQRKADKTASKRQQAQAAAAAKAAAEADRPPPPKLLAVQLDQMASQLKMQMGAVKWQDHPTHVIISTPYTGGYPLDATFGTRLHAAVKPALPKTHAVSAILVSRDHVATVFLQGRSYAEENRAELQVSSPVLTLKYANPAYINKFEVPLIPTEPTISEEVTVVTVKPLGGSSTTETVSEGDTTLTDAALSEAEQAKKGHGTDGRLAAEAAARTTAAGQHATDSSRVSEYCAPPDLPTKLAGDDSEYCTAAEDDAASTTSQKSPIPLEFDTQK